MDPRYRNEMLPLAFHGKEANVVGSPEHYVQVAGLLLRCDAVRAIRSIPLKTSPWSAI